MTFFMRCDACGQQIVPPPNESQPDKSSYVELQASDTPQRRRHYHRLVRNSQTESCWDVIKAALLAAEQAN